MGSTERKWHRIRQNIWQQMRKDISSLYISNGPPSEDKEE